MKYGRVLGIGLTLSTLGWTLTRKYIPEESYSCQDDVELTAKRKELLLEHYTQYDEWNIMNLRRPYIGRLFRLRMLNYLLLGDCGIVMRWNDRERNCNCMGLVRWDGKVLSMKDSYRYVDTILYATVKDGYLVGIAENCYFSDKSPSLPFYALK